MCGQPPDVPLCDSCYGLLRQKPDTEEHNLCADCQELMRRWCFCCGTAADEPIGEDGVCKKCLEAQTWYKEDEYEAFGEVESLEEKEGEEA